MKTKFHELGARQPQSFTNSIARKLDEFGCFGVKNEHDIGKISVSDFPEISYLQILFKWWIFH